MLCGCSDGRVKVDFDKSTFEAGNTIVNFCAPYVESESNHSYINTVNEEFAKIKSILIDKYSAKSNGNHAVLDVSCDMTYNNGNVIALLYDGVFQINNQNEEKFRISVIHDLKNGRKININDIFCDSEWENYINSRLRQMITEDSKYNELWEIPSTKILNPENFYLKNGNILVVYFPPYELSYYRRGFVEFEFKLEELSGFMNDDIKALWLR